MDLGVPADLVHRLVLSGHLRRVLYGVLVASQVPDSLRLRVAAVKLVIPEHGVAVDATASWVHGVDALPRSAIHEMPTLDVYSLEGHRIRRSGVRSGSRGLLSRDVEVIDGLQVTTKHRTCLDLGRFLWRYDALGAIDGFLRAGVCPSMLQADLDRFKGFRGVRQLRELLPLATPLAESNPESALRLFWIESGIGDPQPQVWVDDDAGTPRYRIDIGDPEVGYGVEYFGEEFHDVSAEAADNARLSWLDERGWEMDVFRKEDVYAWDAAPIGRLRAGWKKAQERTRACQRVVIDLAR